MDTSGKLYRPSEGGGLWAGFAFSVGLSGRVSRTTESAWPGCTIGSFLKATQWLSGDKQSSHRRWAPALVEGNPWLVSYSNE